MKKLSIILAALALSGAAFAQQTAKDSIAAVKAVEKARKVQQAIDLKAFKEKQKVALAEFIAAQKQGKVSTDSFVPTTLTDSMAYMFGVAQSQSLLPYITGQLGVDTMHLSSFCEGLLDKANADPNDKPMVAYSAGEQIASQSLSIAGNITRECFSADPSKKIDAKIIAQGLVDGLTSKAKVSFEEANTIFQKLMTAQKEYNSEAMYKENRENGQRWLEENKKKEGVITLPSGLQYKVLTEGTGEIPTANDKVKVNYEGRLIDGTVFDSSYKRGEPTSFQANRVISGWTEALTHMPVGSKWELYIPYDLAYGEREAGAQIKPYSALIFVVELLEIEGK